MSTCSVRRIAPGVYLFGPHSIPWELGSSDALLRQFKQALQAIEDTTTESYAHAQRLVDHVGFGSFDRLPEEQRPAWLVNMAVIELRGEEPDLLVYSPLPLRSEETIKSQLDNVGNVKVVVAPNPRHTLGLASFRTAYPDALFLCPRGGGFLGDDLMVQRLTRGH